jgi:hypothetical protein
MDAVRTAVDHSVRLDGRESTGELSCERANLVFTEELAMSTPNEKVEEILGLGCAVATPFCSVGVGWSMIR